jgi:uncharacterized protein (TIGR02145 family)
MSTKTIFHNRITWMVLFCFFSLASLQAWPAADQKKLQPNHDRTAKATTASSGWFEKEEPAKIKQPGSRRFPLFVILGAAVAAGILVYLLTAKKDKTDDENQPLVIEPAGSVTDYDGNVYQAVRIGNQVWMAENLRSTHYSDGSAIASIAYNDDESNAATYGRLYAPAAVRKNAASSSANPSGVQGAAPTGWHIPSPAEWRQLANALGGASVAGGKMKESGTAHWLSPNSGATNESLFKALPAGMHRVDMLFQWLETRSVFATSEEGSTSQTITTLWHDRTELTITGFHPGDSVSIRCVKD